VEDGYEVELEPLPDRLPAALRGFRPDLIARRLDENVVVEVTSSPFERKITDIARAVDSMAGWRFDLVVTSQRRPSVDHADESPAVDRHAATRRAYRFLRERDGSTVTAKELASAAGWSDSTTRTYISKNLKPWLTRVGAGEYLVGGLTSLVEDRFIARQSQGKPKDDEARTLRSRLDTALRSGEGGHREFKASIPSNAQGLRHEIAAFATNGGGQIYVGVSDDGTVPGLADAASAADHAALRERIEGIARGVAPAVAPEIDFVDYDGRTVCIIDVPNGPEPVYYVDHRPYVRVGSESRPARPDEVKALVAAAQFPASNLERHRPLFGRVSAGGLRRLEQEFEPSWQLEHIGGDTPPNIEWRFRGPRFGGTTNTWRQVPVSSLPRHHVTGVFNLAERLRPDDQVAENELGLEIRFEWLGHTRFELHRWLLIRSDTSQKKLWDIGDELPIIRGDKN